MKGKMPVYTSKIIKASALLPDTRLLLAHWDDESNADENLRRLRQENIFGKTSRSRVEDILGIFRQRYLRDQSTIQGLTALVRLRVPSEILDRILFFYAAQTDLLLHDVVTEVLWEWRQQGRVEISVHEVLAHIQGWVAEERTTSKWSSSTTIHVARHIMATLRDFGVLSGAVKKRLAPAYLPVEAFAFLAFVLHQNQPSGQRLIHHPEWKLFFLYPGDVECHFLEAHQHNLLEFHAAGSIIRLEFPCATLGDYAHVIAGRAA